MATLLGNIFKEAQLINSDSGTFIAFTLVEKEKYKTKEGKKQERNTYFNCVMWNADKLAPYLTKGIPVQIIGNITAKTYTDANNKTKAGINVLVRKLDLISYPKATKESTDGEAFDETFDESIEAA